MPRRATEITLNDEERAELERVAALQKAPHREVQRAKLVLYAAAGSSNVEIATRLDMSAKNVGRWRQRFRERRLEGLGDAERAGRPRRFPPEQVAEVKATAEAVLAEGARPGGGPPGAAQGRLARGQPRQALRVRPANVELRNAANREGAELEQRWLLAEWPPGAAEPVKYWLSNLPAETKLKRLVSLAKLRWRVEHDYREQKDALGLDHFEGLSHL